MPSSKRAAKGQSPASTAIRDFIYLDVERLKSILSQIEQGYLEQQSRDSSSSRSATGSVEGALPFLARVGGTGQYMWTNQSSETRTLHDHIYAYVEEKLLETNQLLVLNEELDAETWLSDEARQAIPDTSFVLVRGRPLISNYRHLKSFMTDFNKVAGAVGRMAVWSQVDALAVERRKAALDKASRTYQIPEHQIKDMILALDAFVRQDVVIRLMPFEDSPNARAISALDVPLAYRMGIDSMIHRFGSAPRTHWTLFGQVSAVPLSTDETFSFTSDHIAALESAMQGIFNSLRVFEPMATSVVYPEISITPIAVYRG